MQICVNRQKNEKNTQINTQKGLHSGIRVLKHKERWTARYSIITLFYFVDTLHRNLQRFLPRVINTITITPFSRCAVYGVSYIESTTNFVVLSHRICFFIDITCQIEIRFKWFFCFTINGRFISIFCVGANGKITRNELNFGERFV